MLIDIIWNWRRDSTVLWCYKINELGFSLKYVSILSIMYADPQVTFSNISADMQINTWSRLLIHSFINASAFTINVSRFLPTDAGCSQYTTVFMLVKHGGINSGVINIIYDYVDKDKIHKSFGTIKYAAGGVSSFIASFDRRENAFGNSK